MMHNFATINAFRSEMIVRKPCDALTIFDLSIHVSHINMNLRNLCMAFALLCPALSNLRKGTSTAMCFPSLTVGKRKGRARMAQCFLDLGRSQHKAGDACGALKWPCVRKWGDSFHSTVPKSHTHYIPHSALHFLHTPRFALHPLPHSTPRSVYSLQCMGTVTWEKSSRLDCSDNLFHKNVLRGCIRVRGLHLVPMLKSVSRSTAFSIVLRLWSVERLKSRLAKAAGAEPSGHMRDEKWHAVVAQSRFRS